MVNDPTTEAATTAAAVADALARVHGRDGDGRLYPPCPSCAHASTALRPDGHRAGCPRPYAAPYRAQGSGGPVGGDDATW